jgi:hypothetical protein
MGRHSAERIPTPDLRRSYACLREAYERLLRDHMELKSTPHGPPGTAPGGPLQVVSGFTPSHLATDKEPLGVDDACELVRSSGLLTSPGLGT